MGQLGRAFPGHRPNRAERTAVVGDRILAERDARIAELETLARGLSAKLVLRDRELRELREELAESRSGLRSLASVGRQLDQLQSQARGQATRIRIRALRDAAELGERVTELARLPGGAGTQLVEAIQDAIGRVADADELPEPVSAEADGTPAREPQEVFEGAVQVEVGPLSDFAQLVSIEDAANAIGATSEISITRFSGGRATLAMRLTEPVALLRELEERCDLEFSVRSQIDDTVVLDVDPEERDEGGRAEAA